MAGHPLLYQTKIKVTHPFLLETLLIKKNFKMFDQKDLRL